MSLTALFLCLTIGFIIPRVSRSANVQMLNHLHCLQATSYYIVVHVISLVPTYCEYGKWGIPNTK